MDGAPGEWRIHFHRQFGLLELVEWDNLCREVQGLPLGEEVDAISWSLEASVLYSIRSMYLALSQGANVTRFKDVWRTRVPPKIKIFLWPSAWGLLMAYVLFTGTWRTATTFSSLAHLQVSCGPRYGMSSNVTGTRQGTTSFLR
jgi:hypothetical protein